MKMTHELGLGKTLDSSTEILHSSVLGKNSIGRIGDLVAVWCDKNKRLSQRQSSDARILIQALLDFAQSHTESELAQFEFAVEEQRVYASVRIANQIVKSPDLAEKALSQYWLTAEESSNIKRVLNPTDRVEVRFNPTLNVVEWRVARALKPEGVSLADSSFLILIDQEMAISTENNKYINLGDLPYQEWLDSIYQNKSEKAESGEFFINGESVQNESEWARVVSDREAEALESESTQSIEHDFDADFAHSSSKPLSERESDAVSSAANRHVENLRIQLLTQQAELKEEVKQTILASKRKELIALRDAELALQKTKLFEKLLRKKEIAIQTNQAEIYALRQRLKDQSAELERKFSSNTSTHHLALVEQRRGAADSAFKEKAMQMFQQLKKVKEQNILLQQKLERAESHTLNDSNLEPESGIFQASPEVEAAIASNVAMTGEEIAKKLERTQRALESEKAKVASLSERVIVAEKEAQSASPLVQDLERKVETALKTVQQQKKETETVKQKLVQAEAEKNKIKNELVKAQAQIQTLMKRHAS